MCGLLGFATTEKLKSRSLRKSFLFTGFPMIATRRGMESSGIALVEEGVKDPLIYKKALWGGDFIMHQPTVRLINDIERYSVGLGHVRAATTGRGNVTDFNAHPFQYDHITLVHNGHIRNANQLPGARGANCEVDSAMVAYSMAKNGEIETLTGVEEGFVFIWWNSNNGTLNIARNNERPLHMAYIEKENSFFWASELTALAHLLDEANIDEKSGGILYPGTMVWYQYNLKDLRQVKKVPFVSSQGWRQSSSRVGLAQGPWSGPTGEMGPKYEGQGIAEWDDETEDTSQTKTSSTDLRIGTKAGGSELDEIREQIKQQRGKDAKQNGIPTSAKRKARAEKELGKLGLTFQQLKMVEPFSWTQYHNQREYGSVLGQMRSAPSHIVEVVNMRKTDYEACLQRRILAVRVSNVKAGAGPDGKPRVVGVLAPEWFAKYVKREPAQDVDTAGTKADLPTIVFDHRGPGGALITRQKFLELAVHGCANCKRDLDPTEHESLIWVGTPPDPICKGCQTPGIMESLGFPEHLKSPLVH